jgi:hypothetical protein
VIVKMTVLQNMIPFSLVDTCPVSANDLDLQGSNFGIADIHDEPVCERCIARKLQCCPDAHKH